jgi:hypothetical protein
MAIRKIARGQAQPSEVETELPRRWHYVTSQQRCTDLRNTVIHLSVAVVLTVVDGPHRWGEPSGFADACHVF